MGLLPWGFFSNNLDSGVSALIGNMTLLNKVHCPREVFPISSVAAVGITSLIQTAMLLVFFVYYQFMPKATSIYAIPLVLMLIVLTTGLTILISILVVYLRDIRRVEPLITQFGLFLTPVGYPLTKFKHYLWAPMSFINPMVPIIDGIRRSVLEGLPPRWNLVGIGMISTCIYFFGGYILFKKIEAGIADVA
jgi:ABC-2 type transport system permease protein/lipopolysaccharide transport system permease protein